MYDSNNNQNDKQLQFSPSSYSLHETNESSTEWFFKIAPLSTKNSSFQIILKTLIFSSILILSLYYALSNYQQYQSHTVLGKMLGVLKNDEISMVLTILSFCLQIYIFQIILVHHLIKISNIPLISTINMYLSSNMLIIIEINILLIYISFLNDNLPIFKIIILAFILLVNLFVDYFMMPNRNLNDFHFTTETTFILLFRCCFALVIIFSLADYYHNLGFLGALVSFVLNIVLFYGYHQKGGMLYHHQISSFLFSINFSLIVTINTTVSLQLFTNFEITTPVIIFLLVLSWTYKSANFQAKNPIQQQKLTLDSLKTFVALNNRLNGYIPSEKKSFFVGLIYIHLKNCVNQNCFSKKTNIYCIQSKQKLFIDNFFSDQQLGAILALYIKCLFEGMLQKDGKNMQLLLSYCEHSLYSLKTPLSLPFHLCYLQKHQLDFSQKIRLRNIKSTIIQMMDKQNKMYHSELILEKIIQLDDCYSFMLKSTKQVIQKNIEIWSNNRSTTQKEILNKIYQIQTLRKKMSKILINYPNFYRHPQLNSLLAFNQLYLNNEFKKQREITTIYSKFLKSDNKTNHYQDSNSLLNTLVPGDCFCVNSIIILSKFSLQRKLIITNVTINIHGLLGYDVEQLKSMQIDILIPEFLNERHKKLLQTLMNEGIVKNEVSLQSTTRAVCVKKDQTFVAMQKSYKIYANTDGQIQFACIMKVFPIQPIIIVSSCQNEIIYESSQLQHFLSLKTIESRDKITQLIALINKKKQENASIINSSYIQVLFYQHLIRCTIQTFTNCRSTSFFLIMIQSNLPQDHSQSSKLSEQILPANSFNNLFREQYLTNIFMKQQNYLPSQQLTYIRHLINSIYIFGTVFVILPIILTFITKQHCDRLLISYKSEAFMIKFIKQPYILGIHYYQAMMDLQEEQHLDEHIQQHHQIYLQNLRNEIMLRTVFDSSIFVESHIMIGKQQQSPQQLSYYQMKDVFFTIGSLISSYQRYGSSIDPVQLNRFNRMMIPFYNELQKIKNRLLFIVTQNVFNLFVLILVYAVIALGIYIVNILVVSINFNKLGRIWADLLKVFLNPQRKQYSIIIQYWKSLQSIISQHNEKIKMGSRKCLSSITNQAHFSAIPHDFDEKDQISKQQKKMLAIGVISMTGMIAIAMIIQYLLYLKIDRLTEFSQDGAIFLKGYPSEIIFAYSLVQRHYNQTVLNIRDREFHSFSNVLNKFKQFSDFTYISAPQQSGSRFYELTKKYFYGKPCENIPQSYESDGTTYQKCMHYGQGNMNNGIIAFERYTSKLIQSKIQKYQLLQVEQINQLVQSLILMNSFIQSILDAWIDEYQVKIKEIITDTSALNISAIVTFICGLIIIYGKFISKLIEYSNIYKQAYSLLMTRQRIQTDKIAQSELIKFGFLEKK